MNCREELKYNSEKIERIDEVIIYSTLDSDINATSTVQFLHDKDEPLASSY